MSTRSWQPIDIGGDVPPPQGAYSRAIRPENLVFVSGQVPRDPATGALQGEDLESQTLAVFDNIRRVLAAAGATLDDVVSITAWLADIRDWDRFDAIYRAAFKSPYPTRTTVGAQLHGVLVEMTAIAALSGPAQGVRHAASFR
jgi:2-iminobutanoate/2-iminopropanoate deaminase